MGLISKTIVRANPEDHAAVMSVSVSLVSRANTITALCVLRLGSQLHKPI